MRKMLIPIILFLPICTANAASSDITFLGSVKRIAKSGPPLDYSHYCHLNTVYLSGSESTLESMALVWNHNTGQPLKCSEYKNYFEQSGRHNKAER